MGNVHHAHTLSPTDELGFLREKKDLGAQNYIEGLMSVEGLAVQHLKYLKKVLGSGEKNIRKDTQNKSWFVSCMLSG